MHPLHLKNLNIFANFLHIKVLHLFSISIVYEYLHICMSVLTRTYMSTNECDVNNMHFTYSVCHVDIYIYPLIKRRLKCFVIRSSIGIFISLA